MNRPSKKLAHSKPETKIIQKSMSYVVEKKKEEPPKVLVQVPSVYSVEIDLESPQTKEFSKKIMERLAQEYPLSKDEVLTPEFELKDSLPKIREEFKKHKKDEHYGAYEQLFFSRSPMKMTEDRLLALSNYVGPFLRGLGFEVPAQDIEIGEGKIRAYIRAVNPEKINDALKKYREENSLSRNDEEKPLQNKNKLRSIHLVVDSLEPTRISKIFLVLDGHFEIPISFEIKNKKGGDTYIRKLYDIAYSWGNAPGKRVPYNKILASDINNALFKVDEVAKYMRTNKFEKPTLVQKTSDGILALKNEILIKTELIKNIPTQHQSSYRY